MCAARRECNQQQHHHHDYAAHVVLIMARRLNTLRDGPSHLISRPSPVTESSKLEGGFVGGIEPQEFLCARQD